MGVHIHSSKGPPPVRRSDPPELRMPDFSLDQLSLPSLFSLLADPSMMINGLNQVLKEIQNGKFAKTFLAELQGGGKKFRAWEAKEKQHPIEVVGRKLRKNMKWIESKEV